jgi:chromosomal replication initiation ATPase DnaA
MRLADLRSRLNTATPVGIPAPDDVLIAGVLAKLLLDRGLAVANEVISYALPRMERSFAAARTLVADVDATALGSRRKVTIPLLREVLETLGRAA